MNKTTYDTDFYAWTRAQAEALRAKDWPALDLDHLAEEIDSLGIADEHAITRQLQRLLLHLLKWRYQPTHLPLETFPESCSWAIEQVLAEDFWPEDQP
jgi:hypothetical protein